MKKKLILLAPLYLLLIGISNNFCQSVDKTKKNDSLIIVKSIKDDKALTIQEKINQASKTLDNYYAIEHRTKKNNKEISSLKNKKIKLEKEIQSRKSIIEKSLKSSNSFQDSIKLNEKKIETLIKKSKKKDTLKLAKDTLLLDSINNNLKDNLAKEKRRIEITNQNIDAKEKSISIIEAKLKLSYKKDESFDGKSITTSYKKYKSNTEPFFKDSLGEIKFSYKKQGYLGFVADLERNKIQFHINYRNVKDPKAIKYIQLGKVKSVIEKSGKEVLMLTNGGMYTPRNNPEGLLIADSVEIEAIDLEKPSGFLNFYMMPNGVFYINNNKGYIEESSAFNEKYKSKKINPSNATQSGPMLVINNKHHPSFNHGSSSKKLRSGVGIMPNGKLVFLISNRSVTNFHDFATIFKDVFGCENALFLDGAISKIYLKNNNPKTIGGNFGPIISVINK